MPTRTLAIPTGPRQLSANPIDFVIARLSRHRRIRDGYFVAACPAHDDRTPSLSVTEMPDGSVRLKCFSAQCSTINICTAIGIRTRDLFPQPVETFTTTSNHYRPLSPESIQYALRREYRRLVAAGAPRVIATKNAARARIANLYAIRLSALPELHSGGLHGDDPLFAALFRWYADAALREIGSTIMCDEREQYRLPLPAFVRIAAENRAARELHRIMKQIDLGRAA